MGSRRNRLIAASTGFVLLLVITLVLTTRSEEEEPEIEADARSQLPVVEPDEVTTLRIRAPEEPAIRLEKHEAGWRIMEPMEAEANANYVTLALRKLGELHELHRGVSATRPDNHERLGVDEANGLEVTAHRHDEVVAHLFIGAFKGGATMVRVAGEDTVHSLKGSLKATFNRNVSDWRERKIVDRAATEVREIQLMGGERAFHFVRDTHNNWAQAEGQEPLEDFEPAKVQSVASSLSRMRAADFADPAVGREEAGIGDDAHTARLVFDDEEIVLRLGGDLNDGNQFYLVREGRAPIYVVSKFLAERIASHADQFRKGGAGRPAGGTEGQLPEGITQEQMDQVLQQIQKTPVQAAPPPAQ
jgi:hypothetical protein